MENTNKLPPEIEKIRDENADKADQLRVTSGDAYHKGFNDAFHLGRQFERDELAKRSVEFDEELVMEYAIDHAYEPDMLASYRKSFKLGAAFQHQQTSLAYEARIAKLEEELGKK